jgi:hypothetical protein
MDLPAKAKGLSTMLCRLLDWRDRIGLHDGRLLRPDSPVFRENAALRELWPSYICGTDTHGHVVHIERLSEVRVDVLVKGGDYKAKEIVGYDTVTQNGGRVEIIPFVEGRSTTNLVNLIRERS